MSILSRSRSRSMAFRSTTSRTGGTRIVRLIIAALSLASCELRNPFGGTDSPADLLRAAEMRWRERGFTSYRYVSQVSCFCASIGDADVVVLNGLVTSVVRRSTGVSEPVRNRQSIDSLFAFIRQELVRQPERLSVSYDREMGYPRTINWGTPENDGGGFIGATEVQGLR